MCLLSGNQKGLIFILMLILSSHHGFAQKTPFHQKEFIGAEKPFTLNHIKQQSIQTSFFLPQNHYASQLGYMCKKEWQVEKKTGFPFRLRLGSASYCDWLEGKPNAVRQNP